MEPRLAAHIQKSLSWKDRQRRRACGCEIRLGYMARAVFDERKGPARPERKEGCQGEFSEEPLFFSQYIRYERRPTRLEQCPPPIDGVLQLGCRQVLSDTVADHVVGPADRDVVPVVDDRHVAPMTDGPVGQNAHRRGGFVSEERAQMRRKLIQRVGLTAAEVDDLVV